jgi:uncharacterized membrane protein
VIGVREDPRVILVCLWAEAVKDKARRRKKMIEAMDRDLALVWYRSVNIKMSIVPALQSLSLVSSSQARHSKHKSLAIKSTAFPYQLVEILAVTFLLSKSMQSSHWKNSGITWRWSTFSIILSPIWTAIC